MEENARPRVEGTGALETILLGSTNPSHSTEYSSETEPKQTENVDSLNNSNTTIIRPTDDCIQFPHVRVCTACPKRIDPEHYFSWEFMEFCNLYCISKFQGMNFKCTSCSCFMNNTFFGKFYIHVKEFFTFFCSASCMDRYNLIIKSCSYCERGINSDFASSCRYSVGENFFCSEICSNLFNIIVKPPVVPEKVTCNVCKQDKPITIVLKHDGASKYFCTKRCLIAYSFVELETGTEQCITCRNYYSQTVLEKYIVYYENVLIFCSTNCRNIYRLLNRKTVNCAWCQNPRNNFGMIRKFSNSAQNVYICSVNCFKLYQCSVLGRITAASTQATSEVTRNECLVTDNNNTLMLGAIQNRSEITSFLENNVFVTYAGKPVNQRNVATMCFPPKVNKDVTAQPEVSHKAVQSDREELSKQIVPVPVPIYVPTPLAMYSIPVPTPVPFIVPIPIPIFIPITKHSLNIFNDIEAAYNKMPSDPYEAELLKIADIIAEDEIRDVKYEMDSYIPSENPLWKIEEYMDDTLLEEDPDLNTDSEANNEANTGTKRLCDADDLDSSKAQKNKKQCPDYKSVRKVSLNYMLGTNALKQWLSKHLLKTSGRKNICKTDILQMSSNELNLTIDSFIQELKKPDGSEYAPDTIFYLCLGIQYYLYENGRNDNIFLDSSYNTFFDTLNKFAEKFNSFYQGESHFVITRVEEEHLWETKQLGCHSPQVLLNTLVFFNTKYYYCSTLEQHLDISFFQILKFWRKKGKSKSLILRFHSKTSKGTTMYEQYPNETDQTRCPIKLYEFYLSKCPESVKNSNASFYLQPEQYCTCDSPLWYMSSALSSDVLERMINRFKMVKEINIELLRSK